MKIKILKTIFQLFLFIGLSLFYSCSQDDYEPITETKDGNELIESDKISETKSTFDPQVAWVWYNGNDAPVNYQYNHDLGSIQVYRISTGYYRVTFPGRGSLFNGIIHAKSYRGNHSTQVQSWGESFTPTERNLVAYIRCFDPSGNPIDGNFVAMLYKKEGSPRITNTGYLATHTNQFHNYNSKGQENTVRRVKKGIYTVEFKGLEIVTPNFRENYERRFQITTYGSQPRRCKIAWNYNGTNGANAIIHMYDMNGNRADGDFLLSYNDFPALLDNINARFVHYNGSNAIPTDSDIDIDFLENGNYRVKIPISYNFYTSSNVMISSYGGDPSYTSIKYWFNTGNYVYVYLNAYNPDGTLLNEDTAKFNVLYQDNYRVILE